MAKRKKKSDFYGIFIGEFVELVGEFSSHSLDGRVSTIQGFLLDMDDVFFYLGTTPDGVSAAIRQDKVFTIQVVEVKNPLKDMLERWSAPENKENAN